MTEKDYRRISGETSELEMAILQKDEREEEKDEKDEKEEEKDKIEDK
jgi:hypothetical protein